MSPLKQQMKKRDRSKCMFGNAAQGQATRLWPDPDRLIREALIDTRERDPNGIGDLGPPLRGKIRVLDIANALVDQVFDAGPDGVHEREFGSSELLDKARRANPEAFGHVQSAIAAAAETPIRATDIVGMNRRFSTEPSDLREIRVFVHVDHVQDFAKKWRPSLLNRVVEQLGDWP